MLLRLRAMECHFPHGITNSLPNTTSSNQLLTHYALTASRVSLPITSKNNLSLKLHVKRCCYSCYCCCYYTTCHLTQV